MLSQPALSGAGGAKHARLAWLALALVLGLAACVSPAPAPSEPAIVVEVGTACFNAELAVTADERYQGLSGRASLADDAAMWFDLGSERQATFVMRGMRFDIDIVWVDEALRVVHVSHRAEASATDGEGGGDGALERYSPGVPVRYVLEIGAGLAQAHGIELGALVRLTPR